MASVSGGRGPNATSFAVKSNAAWPSNSPVWDAGGATSLGSNCGTTGAALEADALADAEAAAVPGAAAEALDAAATAFGESPWLHAPKQSALAANIPAMAAARHPRLTNSILVRLRFSLAFAPEHHVRNQHADEV